MIVDVIRAIDNNALPDDADFDHWVTSALQVAGHSCDTSVAIRLVDAAEMQTLNHTYRHKDKPTNVLSFPFDMPDGIDTLPPFLGDLAICAEVVFDEATAQNKTAQAHWAHMVVHGTLHLLGYDHIDDAEADIMERLEITILNQLGYPDPYQTDI